MEYLYVIDGELEYSVNGEKVILHGGEGILVNSKRIHSNHSVPGVHCAFYCAITHPSLLCPSKYMEQTYVNPLIDPHSFDYLLLRKDDWTVSIIDELSMKKYSLFHFIGIYTNKPLVIQEFPYIDGMS